MISNRMITCELDVFGCRWLSRLAPGLVLALAGTLGSCAIDDGESSADDVQTQVSAVTTRRGVDYSFARPSPQGLRSAGYTFVSRYLSNDTPGAHGKILFSGEANALIAAGLDIIANFEFDTTNALGGFNAGANDARTANAQALAAGMPSTRPIYFSVDFDAAPGDQPAIDAYMDGAASVIGRERVGAYAGFFPMKRLFDAGKIAWGWQTFAWSGGHWDLRAQIRQIQNGVVIAGGSCDIDEAQSDDFGQWGARPVPGAGTLSGEAYLFGDQQHFVARSAAGSLINLSWSPSTGVVRPDWGGASLAGNPVGYTQGDQQHVFARGTDNTLRHWWSAASGGPGLDDWGAVGRVTSNPAGFGFGTQQHVVYRAPDGSLEHRFYDRATQQVVTQNLGGRFVGDPTAYVDGDQFHVFARDAGNTLVHWFWRNGDSVGRDNWGAVGRVTSDPAGFAFGTQQHVFYRAPDGSLEHRFFDKATGKVVTDRWGGQLTGNPSAYVDGGQQHVFARDASKNLVHWFWSAGNPIGRDDWGAVGRVTGDPSGFATSTQQHVFFRAPDGTIEHRLFDKPSGRVVTDNWGAQIAP